MKIILRLPANKINALISGDDVNNFIDLNTMIIKVLLINHNFLRTMLKRIDLITCEHGKIK